MTGFEFDYTLWVFVSTIGVFQFAAVKNQLWGFVVFRNHQFATKLIASLLIAIAFFWFFLSADRNVPDTGDGIDGVVQTRWFAISAFLAIALMTSIASITNHRWGANHGWDRNQQKWPPIGLSWIRETTFFRAIYYLLFATYRNMTLWKVR